MTVVRCLVPVDGIRIAVCGLWDSGFRIQQFMIWRDAVIQVIKVERVKSVGVPMYRYVDIY